MSYVLISIIMVDYIEIPATSGECVFIPPVIVPPLQHLRGSSSSSAKRLN